jgi:hypothetical protein
MRGHAGFALHPGRPSSAFWIYGKRSSLGPPITVENPRGLTLVPDLQAPYDLPGALDRFASHNLKIPGLVIVVAGISPQP